MFWLLQVLLFSGQELLDEADGCGAPGYLDNFTFHPFQRIRGHNSQVIRNVSTLNETANERCEELCLQSPSCASYEVSCCRDVCQLSVVDMYELPLEPAFNYDFYNRVYDCGCPPSQGENTLNRYSTTTDGSTLDTLCTNGAVNNDLPRSFTCTSNGWGVIGNTYSCKVVCGTPASIAKGSHNGTLLQYNIGDAVIYTCNADYVNIVSKEKDSVVQCQSDGSWEEVPSCIINCGAPEAIENAVVTDGDIFTPGQHVKYTCNTGFLMSHTQLTSQNITCKEDGMWETVPACIAKCGSAPLIENAIVPLGDTFMAGDNVTYSCDTEYIIAGSRTNSHSIFCQDDGNWSNHQNCTRYCGAPPVVGKSRNTATEMMYYENEEIVYTCETGYVMIDTLLPNATLTCLNTGLWEDAPFCIVHCGRPVKITNGIVSDEETFLPGQNVTYTCSDGYVITDTKEQSKTIACRSNGFWEDKPSCSVTCGAPPTVSNADVSPGSVFIPGDSVIYTCNSSYVVNGTKKSSETLLCQNDGNWESPPICTKDCGPSPNVANSSNDAVGTVFVQGDTVTYTCDSAYTILGTRITVFTLICQNEGFWQSPPVCIANCGNPDAVQYATVTSGDTFTPGQTATYTCSSGYVILESKAPSKAIACKDDGKWETKPTCVVNCGRPPNVQNAFIPSGRIFVPGDTVTITCDPTYVIAKTKQSKATITCTNNGNWDQTPACSKDCGPPPSLTNSTHDASSDVYIPNEQVIYTCDNTHIMSGSLQPQAAVTCQDNGMWSEMPMCIVNCGVPLSVQHATKSDQRSILTPGDYITWTCDSQYVVQATNLRSENVICKGDGSWTTKPTCIAYCGEHPAVDHAQVQGSGSQEGDNRIYTCDGGHTMVGTATINCLSNSQWQNPPICPADCGDPPVLNKGSLAGSGNLENNTRNATCGDSYVLEGKSTITCQMNGEWEALPQCTAKEVYQFKQSMFGSQKSPISQQTGITMTVAIILGILLLGIGTVYFYNLCKQKRKAAEKKGNTTGKSESHYTGSLSNVNIDSKTTPQENTYLPTGSDNKGYRS